MFYIQDPFFSQSYTLHEALIRSCSDSMVGYGAYAFASKSGIEILLKDGEFDALLERGSYSIIVGIDEITNMASLDALKGINEKRPNLDIRAFCHNNKGSLFHPKISFFKNEQGTGTLILGSGNLTIGGLRRNREAFSVIPLSEDGLLRIESYWKNWLQESEKFLKPIDDAEVIRKVKENQYEYVVKTKIFEPIEEPKERGIKIDEQNNGEITIEESWLFYPESKVLFAEIPRSGDRWKQANFDIDTFQNFFGAIPGNNSQRILLRHLNNDTSLSPIEVRQSVSVKSQNYRFELDAASGLDYPDNGKPIGVFIQLTTRMFLYHIFMPERDNYDEITTWMNNNWLGRIDRMKRITTSVTDVEEIINNTFFKHYLTQID